MQLGSYKLDVIQFLHIEELKTVDLQTRHMVVRCLQQTNFDNLHSSTVYGWRQQA